MIRFIALLTLTFFMFSAQAFACSCAWRTSPTEELAERDYAFTATVVDMVEPGEFDKVVWKLRVDKVFKGDVPEEFVYETSRHFCAWRRFHAGQSYLIYADAEAKDDTQNILGISDCSRTKAAEGAEDELAELEAAAKAPPQE